MAEIEKWICLECRAIIPHKELVEGFDPWGDRLYFCPECHSNDITSACDEPGCKEEGSCGFPTEDKGYRRTCFEHSVFKERMNDQAK